MKCGPIVLTFAETLHFISAAVKHVTQCRTEPSKQTISWFFPSFSSFGLFQFDGYECASRTYFTLFRISKLQSYYLLPWMEEMLEKKFFQKG